jgi:undecaprenyl-diphosphatase
MAQSLADVPAVERRAILGAFGSLLITLVALAVFSWLAAHVLTSNTQHFDIYIRESIHAHAPDWATPWMLRITTLGNWYVILGETVILLAILLVRRRMQDARLLAVTMFGAGMLDSVLKLLIRRVRPIAYFGFPAPNTYSFPSGHALVTLCFVGFVAGLISQPIKSKWVRRLLWIAAALLVLLVGLSRVYLGVHYPSDVAAGYAAAFAWMSSVGVVAAREQRARDKRREVARVKR